MSICIAVHVVLGTIFLALLMNQFFSFRTESVFLPLNLRDSYVSPRHPIKHNVAACVIIRDSSALMPEFIIRNYVAGVDHFYLYSDDENDEELLRLRTILYYFRRIVTYLPEGRSVSNDDYHSSDYVQMRMYRHCLQQFGRLANWMAFIDTDEFFETELSDENQGPERLAGNRAFLHDILMHYEKFPVLCIRWKSVLTNGRVQPAPQGVGLVDYYPRACEQIVDNRLKLSLRKTILQPRFVNLSATAKVDVALHKGFKMNFPREKFTCVWGLGASIQPPLYLVHYWSRSLYDYVLKIERGRPRKDLPGRTLTDLIYRERACVYSSKPYIFRLRKSAISTALRKVPQFRPKQIRKAFTEELLSGLTKGSDAPICITQLQTLLYKMSNGSTLSQEQYCNKARATKPCRDAHVASKSLWPYAWYTFITSCSSLKHSESTTALAKDQ